MTPDPCDRVELGGRDGQTPRSDRAGEPEAAQRGYLRLWFACANQYARAYKNADGSQYQGRCPKCGAAIQFPIGPGGTSERFFQVSCR